MCDVLSGVTIPTRPCKDGDMRTNVTNGYQVYETMKSVLMTDGTHQHGTNQFSRTQVVWLTRV